jgi:hypothetical protein
MSEESAAGNPGAEEKIVDTKGAASAAPSDSGTLAATAGAEKAEGASEETVKSLWPDDWRKMLAGDKPERMKSLARYADPVAFANKTWALEQKLSSGEMKKDFPKEGTPEEQAAWKKERGVPDKWDAYDVNLGNGYVFGDADKPVLEHFLQYAHSMNMPPERVKETLAWYPKLQEHVAAKQAQEDALYKVESDDSLSEAWGREKSVNLNAIANFLVELPASVKNNFLAGRGADGRLLGDNPDILRWLASLGRRPAASVVSNDAPTHGTSISDRLNELTAMSAKRTSEYWRGPKAEALQQEMRDLLTAQEKHKFRAA